MIKAHNLGWLFGGMLLVSVSAQSADMGIVERWMATKSGASSLKVNFTQTRKMKSVRVPVRQSGTLYLDYRNNRFRWQAGNPAQTIVTKQGGSILIMRPIGKKYEKRPFGSGGDSMGISALAGGFPRSTSDFKRKYRLISTDSSGSSYRIVAAPLGSAGRGVSTFTFIVSKKGYNLRGIEIDLRDGSQVDTSFSSVTPNASVPRSLFYPDLTGWTQTKF